MEFELNDFLTGEYVVHFDNMDQQMEFVRFLYANDKSLFPSEAALPRYVRSDYPCLVYQPDYGRVRCLTVMESLTEFGGYPRVEYGMTALAGIKKSTQSIASFLKGGG